MEIVTDKSKYEIIKELGLLVNSEIKEEFDKQRNKGICPEKIIEELRSEINDEAIISRLASIRAIALNITNKCNFRCGYCSYSGDYKYNRVHGNKSMDYDIALRAVDFFLKMIDDNFRIRKRNLFGISFYGGEPLVEFDLIKRMIPDIESRIKKNNLDKKFKINLRITTNGSLLRKEIVDFLKSKNISIDISLDGPESEHDKFRIGKNGEKTWRTIMGNLEYIRERYPQYYKEKIKFLSTVHPFHDENHIESFFKGNDKLFDIDKIRFSAVNITNLKPAIYRELDKQIKKSGYNRLSTLVFSTIVKDSLAEGFKLKYLGRIKKFTGACFPGGEKVLVDADGKFHICEKMPPLYPIGDVDNGFDFERIRYLLKMYNEEVIKQRCWECDVWFLCNLCYTHAVTDKGIKINCENKKEYYRYLIKRYLNDSEEQNEASSQIRHYDSASDYLDQLQ